MTPHSVSRPHRETSPRLSPNETPTVIAPRPLEAAESSEDVHEWIARRAELSRSPAASHYLAAEEEALDFRDTALRPNMVFRPSPVERRAALLEVLHEAVELHNQDLSEQTLNELSLTLSTDLSPEERLLLLTNEASILHGSGLSFEAAVDHEARTLVESLLNHYAEDPAPHARDLLAAQTYCQLTGASEYSERLVDALQSTGDRIANVLHFEDGLTDPRERIALASLLVEIDRATLHGDVTSFTSDPEESRSHNARAIGERMLARIDMLQAEIDAASELSLEELFTNLRSLAVALAEYDSLTEGGYPMIGPCDLSRRSETAEAALQLVLEEIFAAPADASQAQIDATRAVLYDVRTRIHFAMGNGEPNFLQSLDGTALRFIAERSQEGHRLMVPLGDSPSPEAIEARMEAAAIFAEIGLTNRVNEALNPIRAYARSFEDIQQRFEFLRYFVQIAQSTGMSVEANAMLGEIAELANHDGANEVLHLFAQLVPALQALNDGDLGRAESLLTSLTENPLAVEMLPRVREGVAQIITSRTEMIWRAAFSDYAQRHAENGGDDPEGTERELNQALDRALELLRSGECPSLIAGLERSHAEGNSAIGNFLFEEAAHARILAGLSEPGLSLAEFQDRILASARIAEHEERFNLARQLAGLVRDNPRLASEANALLDGMGVSETVAGLFSPSTLCTIPTPWTIIPGILLSTSDHEVLNALENTAITVGTLGVARWGAMGAEALFVSSRSAAALSPILRRVAGWGVRSASEAAIFTGIGMAHGALASGSMEGLTLENFGRQFGAMLVIFAVCHGVGMGTGVLGRAAESMPSLRNTAGRALIGTTGYVSILSGLVGAEYFNEAIGLSESESDLPWYLRFANAAIMDAQMRAGGHLINGLTGGAIERLERLNARRYQELDASSVASRARPILPSRVPRPVESPIPAARPHAERFELNALRRRISRVHLLALAFGVDTIGFETALFAASHPDFAEHIESIEAILQAADHCLAEQSLAQSYFDELRGELFFDALGGRLREPSDAVRRVREFLRELRRAEPVVDPLRFARHRRGLHHLRETRWQAYRREYPGASVSAEPIRRVSPEVQWRQDRIRADASIAEFLELEHFLISIQPLIGTITDMERRGEIFREVWRLRGEAVRRGRSYRVQDAYRDVARLKRAPRAGRLADVISIRRGDPGKIATLLLAAGTGTMAWLDAATAHASFGIHATGDWPTWLTSLGLGGMLASLFYSRKARPAETVTGQVRLAFDPAAEQRLRLRNYLIEIGGEGMERGDFAVLEALASGHSRNTMELGRATRLASGESTRRARALESLGLAESSTMSGPGFYEWNFRITDLGRRLFEAYQPMLPRLVLAPRSRRLMIFLAEHRFISDNRLASEFGDLSTEELNAVLTSMVDRGWVDRERTSRFPPRYRFRLSRDGHELFGIVRCQLDSVQSELNRLSAENLVQLIE